MRQSGSVLHSATQHSVDAPLRRITGLGLCGRSYLQSKVYQKEPKTVEQLNYENIMHETSLISKEMLNKVFLRFQKCLEDCVNNDGKH